MGTDNLFHKRKAKKAEELSRKIAKRAPYDRVLIVCEGEKTEPYYFQELIDVYGLSSANVEITGQCGSDPMSIVQYAKRRFTEEKNAGNAFDRVYCVFDKDIHGGYQQALIELAKAPVKNYFFAINSVPCFEYWLLLHFVYSTKPYQGLPANSVGNQVLLDLQQYMPDYTKADPQIFSRLINEVERAKANAARALESATANHTDNPSTRVHELVGYLQGLKK